MPRHRATVRTTEMKQKLAAGGITKKQNKAQPPSGGEARVHKQRRWRQGTVSKREVRKLQRRIKPIIPYKHFKALIDETAQEVQAKYDLIRQPRVFTAARRSIQEITEHQILKWLRANQKITAAFGMQRTNIAHAHLVDDLIKELQGLIRV